MRKRIDVPQEKREAIYHELLSLSKEDILPRGAIIRVTKKHDFSEQIILKKGGGDFKSLHMRKERKQLIESGIRNLSLSEEATMIIDTYLESQLLSDTEIATILLTFQQGLSSDENNPTDDTDDTDIVEEGIVLASV